MAARELVVVIRMDGSLSHLHNDDAGLASLGPATVRRASHVEPDEAGQWRVDLAPVGGPALGPFERRDAALAAEREWLNARLAELRLAWVD